MSHTFLITKTMLSQTATTAGMQFALNALIVRLHCASKSPANEKKFTPALEGVDECNAVSINRAVPARTGRNNNF